MTRIRRAIAPVAVAAALAPAAAFAHGDVRATSPAEGARVKGSPKNITISLTEAPTRGAVARAIDGCRKQVPGAVSVDGDSIVLAVVGGEPGTWKVSYRAVSSVDGHRSRGSFDFTVAGSKDCSSDSEDPAESPGPIADPEPSGGQQSPTWLWWVVGGTVVLGTLAFLVRKLS